MEKITIATVLWKGDFQDKDYCDQDVWRLAQSIDRHMDVDYDFICLTNDPRSYLPAKRIMLFNNWPGWWSKLELFRSDLPKRMLYIDLDSFFVRNPFTLLNYKDDLVMMPPRREDAWLGEIDSERVIRYRAGVMLINSKKFVWVYEKFRSAPEKYMEDFRGDDDFLGDCLPEVSTFPYYTVSKFQSVKKRKKLYDDTVIVTGSPRYGSFRDFTDAKWLEQLAYG
jgi:hypothetical protein